MAHQADNINEYPQVCIKDKWYVSRPVLAPLNLRLKDAWRVLTGQYDAIEFKEAHDAKMDR